MTRMSLEAYTASKLQIWVMQRSDLFNYPNLETHTLGHWVRTKIKAADSRTCLAFLLEVKVNQPIKQTKCLDRDTNETKVP